MNTDNREEARLADVLSRHPMPAPTGVDLDQVIRRAGTIRQRRRAAMTGGAALAVLAVVAPMALLQGGDETPAPAASSTPTPNQSAAPSPTTSPAPTPSTTPDVTPTSNPDMTTDLSALPQGAPMRASWIEGNTVRWMNGGTSTLSGNGDWSKFASYHGGVLAVRGGPITETVDEFDNTGRLVASHEGSGIAISQDGTQTAWWWRTQDGDAIHVGISSGMGDSEQVIPTPTKPDDYVQIAGFTETGDLVYTVLSTTSTDTATYITNGTTSTPLTELTSASDVGAGDLVSGNLADGEFGVLSLANRSILWRAGNAVSPSVFSPNGKYVATFDPGDGDASSLQIRDARTGKVVSSWSYDNTAIGLDAPLQWEDDSHLLGALIASKPRAGNDGTVVRLGADGKAESAGTYPFPASQEFPFSTQP